MADKPKLVIVSEVNNLEFLRYHGFYPSEYYTDLDIFRKKAIFFDNVVVMFLTQGSCYFSRKQLLATYDQMIARAEDENDMGIYDAILLSDTVIPTCKDYLKYEDYPMEAVRYSGRHAKSKKEDVLQLLDCVDSYTTTQYLKDADYGFSESALEGVRMDRQKEIELISCIKVPDFESIL